MADGTPQGAPPKKRSISTFVMLSTFMFVLLIMFDNNLRLATGRYVGYALNPVASLWDFDPLWTILFGGVVMILATTAIRHFLVDWVQMARTQEVMRTFQKEFSTARKSNNTYQMKRLTDMQPEVMKLQADMSSEQLKPMAFTMLLVIPIFAWLSTLTAAPVIYDHHLDGANQPLLLLATSPDLQDAIIVAENGAPYEAVHGANLYAYTLPGATGASTGTLTLTNARSGATATVPLSNAQSLDWEKYRVGELAAGSYSIRPEGDANVDFTVGEDGHSTRSHVILAVPKAGGEAQAFFVNGGGYDGRLENEVRIAADSTIYALVPVETGTTPSGSLVDNVRAFGQDAVVQSWTIELEKHLVSPDPDASAARVVPHMARLPWNSASDLNGSWWILPHWIILYSLFSIPFGQVTQKVLKLLEYSKVDLDDDGRAPGLTG